MYKWKDAVYSTAELNCRFWNGHAVQMGLHGLRE
jgi:hypothetical protein